jgi:L-rhamnose mutarotase
MKRFGQHAKLKPECVEKYKCLHAAAWPDVLKTIHACNLRNYSIYLIGTDLFAYFEYIGEDFDVDMDQMAADPVTQDWWTKTKPCFEKHDQQIYYLDMEEIFHYD